MVQFLLKWFYDNILYQNRYLYWLTSTLPFAGQWRVWQRLVLCRLFGKDILELGCGTGDLLADMVELGYNCKAIEKSAEMVDAARSTLKKRRYDEFIVIKGQAQSLPFSSTSFDTVVSTFPNEYILDPDTLSEIKRVLRPGGRLIVIFGYNPPPVKLMPPLLILIYLLIHGPEAFYSSHEEVNQHSDQRMRFLFEERSFCYQSEIVDSQSWKIHIVSGKKLQS